MASYLRHFELLTSLLILSTFLDSTFGRDLRQGSSTTPETNGDAKLLSSDNAEDNFWEQSGQFEGDIMLDASQKTGVIDEENRWPDGVIPYVIPDDEFSEDAQKLIKSVMNKYHDETCIKFRPYEEDSDESFVTFQSSGGGCWSFVGRRGGRQRINLSEGCLRPGIIAHELLHAIGFWHQQSASDRDNYVSIKWDNIKEGMEYNFNKYPSSEITDFGVGYDFDSVMHYGRKAFSKNGEDTIVPHDPNVQIGQRGGLSDKDLVKLKKMYKCD